MRPLRPYRLYGAAELAFAREQATARVSAWQRQWLAGAAAACDLQLGVATGIVPGGLAWVSLQQQGRCFLRREAGVLERWLFGPAAAASPSALAGEVAQAALHDLARRLLDGDAATACGSAAPPADLALHGSGALALSLVHDGQALDVLLDAAAMQRWLASRPRASRRPAAALHPLASCIGAARVRIEASVGEAYIDIATLQSLRPGDVLSLDGRVDRPLRLAVGGRTVARGAWLGSSGGRRALALTAASPLPEAAAGGLHRDLP